jgi:hypothetical protein
MEKKFFTWEAWDEADGSQLFYDCTLIAPIGQFGVGLKFDSIEMNYVDGWIILTSNDEDGTSTKIVMNLTFGAEVK